MLWPIGLIIVCTVLVRSETIHFTNSPHSILTSKNFTTYEIEVPGAKPITIIEATDPYRDVSNGELDSREDHQHQRIPSPTTSFRTSTGIRVTKPIGESSLLESPSSGSSRKTLYSPELLNKFLKEYSEKLRNADSLTRKRLNEITMITNGGTTKTGNQHGKPEEPEEESLNRRPTVAGEDRNDTPESGDTSEEDEAKTEDELIFDETHERNEMALGSSNKRWYQEPPHYPPHHQQQQQQQQHQSHHPWNVKDGWVTLEAVPWSESKVSKWHAANGADGSKKHRPSGANKYWNAAGDGNESEESGGSKYKPIAAIYPTGSSSIGASSYYQGELPVGDSSEDYGSYGTIKNRPKTSVLKQTQPQSQPDSLYNRRRPVVTLYSERPDGPQVDRWYEGPQATVATAPTADPYEAMKAYQHHHHPGASPGTAHRDIITDGRPPNFPKFNSDQQHAGDPYGSSVTSSDQRVRPVSYPERGNGEWVLISTTKGYQYPKRRHGQRAITFSPATSTSHQTVKLTVLPMKNAIDMTTSHNGLIEVSSSTQTVEDAVKEQQQQQHNKRKGSTPSTSSAEVGVSNALPTRRKQKKKQSLAATGGGSFSLMHRRDAAQDSSAVLAAVGAGMVPATMAILAPMVLGKKK
ncbi:hypothetical protein AND_008487 [Anopheles darlingi]|uniref:Uncharacterized protein n=1 Tax=Anopheles darlingi TaxID=43151 RepID=W5JAY1_ANODA|nr:hypothetical protein AND_008487 [Anopheles darlingi]